VLPLAVTQEGGPLRSWCYGMDASRSATIVARRWKKADGVIISRKISRAKLIGAIAELAPAVIAMEVCASALLGPAVPRRGPLDPADQSTLREGVLTGKFTGNFTKIASLGPKIGTNFEANSECYREIPWRDQGMYRGNQGIGFVQF
jgi:hypothetical protein